MNAPARRPAGLPLLGGAPDAPLARRRGRTLTRARFVAEAAALAERLPAEGAMLNLSQDRYRFALGFAAALLRGQTSLLPPNHTADTVARLAERFPRAYALVEPGGDGHGLPTVVHAEAPVDADTDAAHDEAQPPHWPAPSIDPDLVAAVVLTSGSTGAPVPHAKPWATLVRNARVEAARLAGFLGRADLDGATLVATVPPQHMYGFESSVLLALHGGAVIDAGRPFYPADIAAVLPSTPRPRVLVTTPFHLKACVDANLPLPPVDLVVCATAPLSPQLAARAEDAFRAPLAEIYGCTEAGQVATRRTTAGPEWRTFDGLLLRSEGERTIVGGGHVPAPVPLADVIDLVDAQTFRLLGRAGDLVNIAGKRSSIGHLDFHLNAVAGVVDGAFWMPPEGDARGGDAAGGVVRLVAFVVAPRTGAEAIRAELRRRVDAAFLPRRIVHVDALPRAATGKLTAAAFAALAAAHLDDPRR